jgi:predicted regulator of Ras-like GTPase activity (Roadblock/LC7/MglB family)
VVVSEPEDESSVAAMAAVLVELVGRSRAELGLGGV